MAEEKSSGGQFVKVEVIAQIFGVTVRRVQQLTQEGVIRTVEVPGRGRSPQPGPGEVTPCG